MLKLITSFASLGSSASSMYSDVARGLGKGGPADVLKALAKSERALHKAALISAKAIEKRRLRCRLMYGMRGLGEMAEDSFAFLRASSGLRPEDFLESILLYEYQRWTGLVMPLAASLRSALPEALPLLTAAQRHKRRAERLLSHEGRPKGLHFRFRSSDPVWVEKILVVGSFEHASIARNDVAIEVSQHGKDAVERLRERYYAAVLTDVDLDHIDGVEVCKQASKAYPGIEERFLFLHGPILRRHEEYLRRRRLRRLRRPASPEAVGREVARILEK